MARNNHVYFFGNNALKLNSVVKPHENDYLKTMEQSNDNLKDILKMSSEGLFVFVKELFSNYNSFYSNTLVKNLIELQLDLSTSNPKRALLISDIVKKQVDHSIFRKFFDPVIVISENHVLIPTNELVEVLKTSHPEDYCIAINVNSDAKLVTFIRGDMDTITLPFKTIKEWSKKEKVKFDEPLIDDYGQTVYLGDFDMAFDAILYEYDKNYRKRLLKKRREEDKSFGACFRRLRLQKGMSQEDFQEVISARQLGRIESEGETKEVTKEKLSQVVGVPIDEILTY